MKALKGNAAVVEALAQIEPDVFPMFPITPSTQIPEFYEEKIAKGEVTTIMVRAESEHSSASAAHGASLAGARVFNATASQGLAYMHEVLYITSSSRLPVVMAVASRALSGPINIHADHSDSMGSRDCGWMQIFCENGQEAYDTLIQAYRIAEHKKVLLPMMVCFDGFTVSHAISPVEILDTEKVKKFVGEYVPERSVLDIVHPATFGSFALPDYYMEYRRQLRQAMNDALAVITETGKEFGKISGRSYGLIETYRMDDALYAAIVIGSTAATMKDAVDALRKRGIKAGVVKIRSYRPFPEEELSKSLSEVRAAVVLDRADSPGTRSGPLYADTCGAVYGRNSRPALFPHVYGLGGRELTQEEAEAAIEDLTKGNENNELYIGVRASAEGAVK